MSNLSLITGASSGIGLACAQEFLNQGFQVVINYHTNAEELEQLKQNFPNDVLVVQGDLTKTKDITNIFDQAEQKFGQKINFLVNNAGIVNRQKFPDLSPEKFLEVLNTNTVTAYSMSREFYLRLDGQEGSIVNIGSMRTFIPTSIDYSASKAALHNMTVSLAKAMSPQIRVNTIAPGFTKTKMHKGNEDRLEQEGQKSLLKRYSSPEEIAESICFIAQAKSITGQCLLVDNGRSLIN